MVFTRIKSDQPTAEKQFELVNYLTLKRSTADLRAFYGVGTMMSAGDQIVSNAISNIERACSEEISAMFNDNKSSMSTGILMAGIRNAD